jgi:hypothetical protein
MGTLASLVRASDVVTKPTPFGHRPVECVVEVPNGAHVEEDPHSADLIISHPDGVFKTYVRVLVHPCVLNNLFSLCMLQACSNTSS